jgi:hypothetical protein
MGRDASKGELDIAFANADLIEDCLLVVAIIRLADDYLDLFVLVLGVVELDRLVAAQRVDFVVYDGEVAIGDIFELVVLLHTEVLARLLDLRQYLLGLHGQHPLV